MSQFRVALCGNPNVGKSTVFNALTGLRQHTGNWAGKTVDSAQGIVRDQEGDWELIDLPGAYSLLNGSPDELVTSDYLLLEGYDAVVVVCDATCLARSLALALQAARICSRTVVCVNLMDEAHKQGIQLDLQALEQQLLLPVIGISARNRQGVHQLSRLVRRTAAGEGERSCASVWPDQALPALRPLLSLLEDGQLSEGKRDMLAMRLLCADGEQRAQWTRRCHVTAGNDLQTSIGKAERALLDAGYTIEQLRNDIVAADYHCAQKLAQACWQDAASSQPSYRRLRIDRLLCSRAAGIPLMLLLLLLLFYLTLAGANAPSAWLSDVLMGFEPTLAEWLAALAAPQWLIGAVAHGMYRSLAWVVSVMLPPMAIFFPLFTLLEDLGYLPRIAFNLDRCFHGCQACGKQALCMCMGLGCNAVGVTGCRIIQSPRERMIAILTNSLTPCNGRLPFLMALISMFLVTLGGAAGTALSAGVLVGLIVLSVLVTLALSRLLSRTALQGMSSAFVLELPPFRAPKTMQVIIRSMLDRTVFVLMRAVSVAAPAGLLLWALGNVWVDGRPLLQHGAALLDPLGRLMGMDGVILLAFLLGLPANEIVLPIMLMIYLQQGMLLEPAQTDVLRVILQNNGWTPLTALCTALFALFHWPCSTTIMTIRKETGSTGWTLLAVLLPTLAGFALCTLTAAVGRLLQLL